MKFLINFFTIFFAITVSNKTFSVTWSHIEQINITTIIAYIQKDFVVSYKSVNIHPTKLFHLISQPDFCDHFEIDEDNCRLIRQKKKHNLRVSSFFLEKIGPSGTPRLLCLTTQHEVDILPPTTYQNILLPPQNLPHQRLYNLAPPPTPMTQISAPIENVQHIPSHKAIPHHGAHQFPPPSYFMNQPPSRPAFINQVNDITEFEAAEPTYTPYDESPQNALFPIFNAQPNFMRHNIFGAFPEHPASVSSIPAFYDTQSIPANDAETIPTQIRQQAYLSPLAEGFQPNLPQNHTPFTTAMTSSESLVDNIDQEMLTTLFKEAVQTAIKDPHTSNTIIETLANVLKGYPQSKKIELSDSAHCDNELTKFSYSKEPEPTASPKITIDNTQPSNKESNVLDSDTQHAEYITGNDMPPKHSDILKKLDNNLREQEEASSSPKDIKVIKAFASRNKEQFPQESIPEKSLASTQDILITTNSRKHSNTTPEEISTAVTEVMSELLQNIGNLCKQSKTSELSKEITQSNLLSASNQPDEFLCTSTISETNGTQESNTSIGDGNVETVSLVEANKLSAYEQPIEASPPEESDFIIPPAIQLSKTSIDNEEHTVDRKNLNAKPGNNSTAYKHAGKPSANSRNTLHEGRATTSKETLSNEDQWQKPHNLRKRRKNINTTQFFDIGTEDISHPRASEKKLQHSKSDTSSLQTKTDDKPKKSKKNRLSHTNRTGKLSATQHAQESIVTDHRHSSNTSHISALMSQSYHETIAQNKKAIVTAYYMMVIAYWYCSLSPSTDDPDILSHVLSLITGLLKDIFATPYGVYVHAFSAAFYYIFANPDGRKKIKYKHKNRKNRKNRKNHTWTELIQKAMIYGPLAASCVSCAVSASMQTSSHNGLLAAMHTFSAESHAPQEAINLIAQHLTAKQYKDQTIPIFQLTDSKTLTLQGNSTKNDNIHLSINSSSLEQLNASQLLQLNKALKHLQPKENIPKALALCGFIEEMSVQIKCFQEYKKVLKSILRYNHHPSAISKLKALAAKPLDNSKPFQSSAIMTICKNIEGDLFFEYRPCAKTASGCHVPSNYNFNASSIPDNEKMDFNFKDKLLNLLPYRQKKKTFQLQYHRGDCEEPWEIILSKFSPSRITAIAAFPKTGFYRIVERGSQRPLSFLCVIRGVFDEAPLVETVPWE